MHVRKKCNQNGAALTKASTLENPLKKYVNIIYLYQTEIAYLMQILFSTTISALNLMQM